VNYARVWAGGYIHSDALSGKDQNGNEKSTVERWAHTIGVTCADEAGHGYGLDHYDPDDPKLQFPGEDSAKHHLMADGGFYDMEQRAGYRRHFGNYEYSTLAANVGLSFQTMWNWDFKNPNANTASKWTF